MKLLLTSGGITNDSLAEAFEKLVGKPPKKTKIAFIPTAANLERGSKEWLIQDLYRLFKRGYSVDIIELTALSSEEVEKCLREADVIFVGGGNVFYLSYWMQKRGLLDIIPNLLNDGKTYVGISAGSIIAGPDAGLALTSEALKNPETFTDEDYDRLGIKGQSAGRGLSLVDFGIRPHFNNPLFETANKNFLLTKAEHIKVPFYAIDDASAIEISNGKPKVITEGDWLSLNGGSE